MVSCEDDVVGNAELANFLDFTEVEELNFVIEVRDGNIECAFDRAECLRVLEPELL